MFSNAVKLFAIRGFDIKFDPSWLIIAALITWSLSQNYFPQTFPDYSVTVYLLMGLAAMILFFASLLLHELAHSVIARQLGVPVGSITLFLFGGVAELEAEPQSASVEFWVALAGPIMSVLLAIGFWMLSWISSAADGLEVVTAVLTYLATINLVLALFNLVPAFPLDGGRIFRAYLWYRHGDALRATKTAAMSGVMMQRFAEQFSRIHDISRACSLALIGTAVRPARQAANRHGKNSAQFVIAMPTRLPATSL